MGFVLFAILLLTFNSIALSLFQNSLSNFLQILFLGVIIFAVVLFLPTLLAASLPVALGMALVAVAEEASKAFVAHRFKNDGVRSVAVGFGASLASVEAVNWLFVPHASEVFPQLSAAGVLAADALYIAGEYVSGFVFHAITLAVYTKLWIIKRHDWLIVSVALLCALHWLLNTMVRAS